MVEGLDQMVLDFGVHDFSTQLYSETCETEGNGGMVGRKKRGWSDGSGIKGYKYKQDGLVYNITIS